MLKMGHVYSYTDRTETQTHPNQQANRPTHKAQEKKAKKNEF